MKKTLIFLTGLVAVTVASHVYSINDTSVSLHRAGSGRGTMISMSGNIACEGDCKSNYAYGSSIVLKARAAKGSEFIGWTGDCSVDAKNRCGIVVDKNIRINAMFTTISNKSGKDKYSNKKVTKSVSGVLKLVRYLVL